MLAQFSRTTLVQDLGRRLAADFAENLNRRLQDGSAAAVGRRTAPLNLVQLIWEIIRARFRKLMSG